MVDMKMAGLGVIVGGSKKIDVPKLNKVGGHFVGRLLLGSSTFLIRDRPIYKLGTVGFH